jgi:hypothetical protein
MKSPRFLYQESTNEIEGKTRWEDGKIHRIGKAIVNKRYSKKAPLFEKDLVSSSRRISHKKRRQSRKNKYLDKQGRKTRKMTGGANMNGKTFYIGVGIEQKQEGGKLNFRLKDCILPSYSPEINDTHRTFEILYGGGANEVDYKKQYMAIGSNLDCPVFYDKFIKNLKQLPPASTMPVEISQGNIQDMNKNIQSNMEDVQNFNRYLSQSCKSGTKSNMGNIPVATPNINNTSISNGQNPVSGMNTPNVKTITTPNNNNNNKKGKVSLPATKPSVLSKFKSFFSKNKSTVPTDSTNTPMTDNTNEVDKQNAKKDMKTNTDKIELMHKVIEDDYLKRYTNVGGTLDEIENSVEVAIASSILMNSDKGMDNSNNIPSPSVTNSDSKLALEDLKNKLQEIKKKSSEIVKNINNIPDNEIKINQETIRSNFEQAKGLFDNYCTKAGIETDCNMALHP